MTGNHDRMRRYRAGPPRDGRSARRTRPERLAPFARPSRVESVELCDGCGAVLEAGRWYWGTPPSEAVVGVLCPACRRIREHVPAGTIRVPPEFLDARDEVVGMIRNEEEVENYERPLERLMGIEDTPDGGMVVTTTGLRLTWTITEELERRFRQRARIRYPEEGCMMLVDWDASARG